MLVKSKIRWDYIIPISRQGWQYPKYKFSASFVVLHRKPWLTFTHHINMVTWLYIFLCLVNHVCGTNWLPGVANILRQQSVVGGRHSGVMRPVCRGLNVAVPNAETIHLHEALDMGLWIHVLAWVNPDNAYFCYWTGPVFTNENSTIGKSKIWITIQTFPLKKYICKWRVQNVRQFGQVLIC